MTIQTTVNKVTYTGNSATTSWNYSFKIPSSDTIVVSVKDLSVTPNVTTILLPSQYSVTGIGTDAGGQVTYPLAGPALDPLYKITISRVVPYVQPTDYENQGGFYPDVLEFSLDYLTMQTQQLSAQVEDAIELFQSLQVSNGNVPAPGAGDIGKVLEATGIGSYAWGSLTASGISGLGALAALDTVGTAEINNNAVTYGKLQAQPSAGVLGAVTAGATSVLPLGNNIYFSTDGKLDSAPVIDVRQTVLSGPSSGFLPATTLNLSIVSTNIDSNSPLIVVASNGYGLGGNVDRIGSAVVNLTWSGLAASTTNYLYVAVGIDGTLTPGSTTLIPKYQYGGSISVTSGQLTFDILAMKMYVGNGAAAVQTYTVVVGEVATNGSTVISSVAYAYKGKYTSSEITPLLGTNAATSFPANIGVIPLDIKLLGKCLVANPGYAVDDVIDLINVVASYSGDLISLPLAARRTRKNIDYRTGEIAGFIVTNIAGGDELVLTPSSWSMQLHVSRGW